MIAAIFQLWLIFIYFQLRYGVSRPFLGYFRNLKFLILDLKLILHDNVSLRW